jgi:hypothetical protein
MKARLRQHGTFSRARTRDSKTAQFVTNMMTPAVSITNNTGNKPQAKNALCCRKKTHVEDTKQGFFKVMKAQEKLLLYP